MGGVGFFFEVLIGGLLAGTWGIEQGGGAPLYIPQASWLAGNRDE